jgi:hypothetical protein
LALAWGVLLLVAGFENLMSSDAKSQLDKIKDWKKTTTRQHQL